VFGRSHGGWVRGRGRENDRKTSLRTPVPENENLGMTLTESDGGAGQDLQALKSIAGPKQEK